MALTRLLFPASSAYVKLFVLTFVLAAHFTPVVCVNSQRLQINMTRDCSPTSTRVIPIYPAHILGLATLFMEWGILFALLNL